jgi:4-hydroxybenzoate polyprenyltransferase
MALAGVKTFGRMIKFSHSVFALPFALAAATLAIRAGAHFDALRLALIVVAAVCARTAAMGFNRIVDVRIDGKNPRTKNRELVTGAMSVRTAMALTATAAAAFVAVAFAISTLCGLLAPLALAIVLGYSYAKRFTWACHLWLGVALAGAPLGAWIAVRGDVGAPAGLLALAVATWVAGFDILYSLADIDFDRSARLHSIPARFGIRGALGISSALHVVTVAALIATGAAAQLGLAYAAGVVLIAALLVWEHRLVRPDDLSRLDAAFFALNGWVSVAYLAAVLCDSVMRSMLR